MPPRHLSVEVFQTHSTGTHPLDTEGKKCPIKLGNPLWSPRKSWRTRLGRRMHGLPCLSCCHHVLNPDKQGKYMDLIWLMVLMHVFLMTSWSPAESVVTTVNPNWQPLPSFKLYRCMCLVEYLSQELVVHLHPRLRGKVFWGQGLGGCWIPANPPVLTVCWSSLCANSHSTLYLFIRQGVVWSGTTGPQVQTSFLPLPGW